MADKKVTALDALTTLAAADLFLVVDDVAGTPTSKKISASDISEFVVGNVVIPTAVEDLNDLADVTVPTPVSDDLLRYNGTAWVNSTKATALDGYATLVSPTFTGTVTLPSGQALIAPALGTPASGVMTNVTGLPTAGLLDGAVTSVKVASSTASTKTVSYVLVAADRNTKVIMNAAGATTITVNTGLFAAGDEVFLHNIGAGVCTVTAGTATVASAGSLAVPSNGSGTLYFTSAGVSIYFPSAVTAAASALVYLDGASFSAQTSFSTAAIFTALYNNYKIIVDITSTSVHGAVIQWRLRSGGYDNSTANYFSAYTGTRTNTVAIEGIINEGATFGRISGMSDTIGAAGSFDILAPFVTEKTRMVGTIFGATSAGNLAAYSGGNVFNASTSFDAATFFPASGNFTGSYKVYGITNS